MDYAYFLLGADNSVKLVECETPILSLNDLYCGCSCDCIDIVQCCHSLLPLGPLNDVLLMSVDDNGKLKNKPVNLLASALYGNPNDCIVGDCVLGWSNPISICEPDLYALPIQIANKLKPLLEKSIV